MAKDRQPDLRTGVTELNLKMDEKIPSSSERLNIIHKGHIYGRRS